MLIFRALAEIAALALAAFATIWVSRAVGPANLGSYAVTTSVFLLGTVLINAGLSSVGAQRVADESGRSGEVWRVVTSGRLILAGIAFAAFELLLVAVPLEDRLRSFVAVAAAGWLAIPFRSEWLLVARGSVGAVASLRVAVAVRPLL